MEIVKGNTEFIEADQTPRTWRVSLNVWDHFYVHYWLNWVHEDDSNDEVGLKKSQKIPNCFIWNCTFRNAQGRCSLRKRGRRCPSLASSTILRHTQTAAVAISREPV